MAPKTDLKVTIVYKLAQKRTTGSNKVTIDTAKNWVQSHNQGDAEDAIEELVSNPAAPVERYGGSRNNIRLSSMDAAKEFILDNDGDLPFYLQDGSSL